MRPQSERGRAAMRKTLAAANRGERVPFKIPRSVQQSIPIQRVWQDGIWQVNGRFSQTWRFADINYSLASYEDQRDMFTSYCGVLNSLPTDAVTKITIHNRRLNSSDFQHSVLMRECGDDLDLYRREYNRVLTEKAAASNNLIQDKYITVSVARKNAEEARAFFHRVDADLSKNLGRLDSGAKALDTYERLRILHDFFRPGEEQFYKFDLNASMRLGHSFKDYIAPDGMKFLSDHFELGGKVGRVLFMRKYSSYIKDDMITSMADFPRTLVLSIDLLPVPTDEAVRYYADTCGSDRLAAVLYDVLDTPVSPELLPPEDGKISQKTEDIVGPYELHDFFLYHMLRSGYSPAKIYRIAKIAFADVYDEETILKWLKIFTRRFFAQHFKRSCLPDGPKVGTVAVSPRGDLRMPSDASAQIWLEELEEL